MDKIRRLPYSIKHNILKYILPWKKIKDLLSQSAKLELSHDFTQKKQCKEIKNVICEQKPEHHLVEKYISLQK